MALVQPLQLPCGIEYSIHDIPNRHASEIAAVIPGVDLKGMLIIPTCQHSDVDLVKMGETVELEKDRLLEKFMDFAKDVCTQLESQGFWADFLDPCSGLTMLHKEHGAVYSEVDGFSTLLRYKTANAGCCKVLLHPSWGSYVYPASLLARAPLEKVEAAIQQANNKLLH